MSAAGARRSGGGRDKDGQDSSDKMQKNEGSGGADEERLYHCAECGKAEDLGAIDEEDGQWYCKGCWEALLGDDDPGDAPDDGPGPGGLDQATSGSGYHGPVDEDAEGVALVLSDTCGAGFRLSKEGLGLLRARGKDYSLDKEGKDVPRMDPDFVALVRESASRMSGDGTTLVVRRIHREAYDSNAYRIHNIDGKELLAIDPAAHHEQARALHDLHSRAGEEDRQWTSLAKLLATFHHVLYQGDQSDEERLRRLRQLAPAETLQQAGARPGDALVALAKSADELGPKTGGS